LKFLILNWDYERFLRSHYTAHPELVGESYTEQMAVRNQSLFGVADFYSKNLTALGHQAAEIHANNVWLQAAWARQHGITVPDISSVDGSDGEGGNFTAAIKRRLRPYKALLSPIMRRFGLTKKMSGFELEVLLAQVEDFAPDVILNQDLQAIDSDVMRMMAKPGRLLLGQIGVDPPAHIDLGVYDLGLSQIPWVVQYFRKHGLRAEIFHLGFEPAINEMLGPIPQKDVAVSFVGSLTAAHADRVVFLEEVARSLPLEIWVPSLKGIPASSPLHACRKGEVYGRDMYNVLRRSRVVLNSHIDVARGSATNMRLFEATGVGAFLLTDNLRDLNTLFAPDVEVGVYNSVPHCIDRIRHHLEHETEREEIARAGQARTLSAHTYLNRARELLCHVEAIVK